MGADTSCLKDAKRREVLLKRQIRQLEELVVILNRQIEYQDEVLVLQSEELDEYRQYCGG